MTSCAAVLAERRRPPFRSVLSQHFRNENLLRGDAPGRSGGPVGGRADQRRRTDPAETVTSMVLDAPRVAGTLLSKSPALTFERTS